MNATSNPRIRLTIRISLLVLLGLIIVGLVHRYTGPDPGIAELQRSRAALRDARSWHSHAIQKTAAGTLFREETKDISCPDDYKLETFVPDGQRMTGFPPFYRSTTIHTSGMTYLRLDDASWMSNAPMSYAISLDCTGSPNVNGSKLFYDLDIVIAQGEVKSGERRHVGDDLCRDYSVSWAHDLTPRYIVCINEDDHLPRLVDLRSAQWTYEFSAWNSTTVTAPPI